ncbi:hypothetical protein ACFE04_021200 [Oxalis oulophora]
MSTTKQIPNILSGGLTRENYATFFSVLLDMEEMHLKEDARSHNMKSISKNMKWLSKAVFAAEKLEMEFIFPSESDKRVIETTPIIPTCCLLNKEQMYAVKMILGCKGAPPYLIYGPPRTGKSTTLVETILQLFKTRNDTKMLVCAPSNSAADYLLEKIMSKESDKHEIFRLYAVTLLNDKGLEQGHFSHIFLDDAAQVSEPESMIPISYFYLKKMVVVFAGDHMQLGPLPSENFISPFHVVL